MPGVLLGDTDRLGGDLDRLGDTDRLGGDEFGGEPNRLESGGDPDRLGRDG